MRFGVRAAPRYGSLRRRLNAGLAEGPLGPTRARDQADAGSARSRRIRGCILR